MRVDFKPNQAPETWAATNIEPGYFEQTTNTTRLFTQAGVQYFGYL